jgi:arsenate reductase
MLTVYGIPSCGTVKKARTWLDSRGIAHGWIDLRSTPPDRARVDRWVQVLGASALRNTSGASFRSLGIEKDTWSEEDWAEAFHADPMLIRRPVIERDGAPVLVGFRGSDDELLQILKD